MASASVDAPPVSDAESTPATAAAAAVDPATQTQTGNATAETTQPSVATTSEDGSRKRRSRWGSTPAAAASSDASASTANPAAASSEDGADRNSKRSRWSQPAATPTDANATSGGAAPLKVLETLTPEQLEQFKIQLRIDEITRALLNPSEALREKELRDEAHGVGGVRARSPSPEPLYDSNGQRMNTRPQRYAKSLEKERQELVETLQKSNPNYRPPAGFKKIRYERRLMIPIKEYPDYNFIGMIIGPRGLTQKRMEKESGCKIVIRGRGSTKAGSAHRPQPGDDEDLHVLVSGDNEEMVIATTKEVAKLLEPIDESKNEHKARQLRELAVINGTLRDELICRLCGQPGHRQIQCPQRSQNWQPANIRCQICNSDLHPTADCPQRFNRTAEQAAREMNDEYSSFMADLTGTAPVAQRSTEPLYITDGGNGNGNGSGPPPSGSGPGGDRPPPTSGGGGGGGGGSGYIHPDRLASRGDPSSSYRDRDGGSRLVKGQDPRETFREFRPAAHQINSHSLPAVSHREGFRDNQPPAHTPHGHHYPPPQHGYHGNNYYPPGPAPYYGAPHGGPAGGPHGGYYGGPHGAGGPHASGPPGSWSQSGPPGPHSHAPHYGAVPPPPPPPGAY